MKMKRRLFLLLALCLATAVAIVAAYAPVALFRAQDKALFGKPHSYSQTVGSLGFSRQDIPLVRALENMNTGEDYGQQTLSERSRAELDTLLPRVWEYVDELTQAGVLPPRLQEYLEENLFSSATMNFSHTVDNRGYEYITCNFGIGVTPPYYLGFGLDMSQNRILQVEFNLPEAAPWEAVDPTVLLDGYIAYLGLDVVEDWRHAKDEGYTTDSWEEYGYESFYAGVLSTSLQVQAYLSWGTNEYYVTQWQSYRSFYLSVYSYAYWSQEEIEQYEIDFLGREAYLGINPDAVARHDARLKQELLDSQRFWENMAPSVVEEDLMTQYVQQEEEGQAPADGAAPEGPSEEQEYALPGSEAESPEGESSLGTTDAESQTQPDSAGSQELESTAASAG